MKKTLLFPFVLGLLITFGKAQAQNFVDLNMQLPCLQGGAADWADIDNDGDLDACMVGFSSVVAELSYIVRNDNGVMVRVDSSIAQVMGGSVDFDDYDNDGDPDLLICGQTNGGTVLKLYRNDSANFVNVNGGLPSMFGIAKWIDVDNDGFLDIITSGMIDSLWTDTTIVLRGDGSGNFVFYPTNLVKMSAHDIAIADYDNDSLPDLFMTGVDFHLFNPLSVVFHNEGNGNFTMDTASFLQLFTGMAKWGDVENDGDLDILYDGIEADNDAFTLIYLNDGAGNFTELPTNLPPTGEPGSVDWADIDNDGDLDVLLPQDLWRNDGNGVFTDISPWPNQSVYALPAQFVDYDQDGDLDLFEFCSSGGNGTTIFMNTTLNSIANVDGSKDLILYPNPAQQNLQLITTNSQIESIEIISLLGQSILKANVTSSTRFNLNIESLSHGMYYASVKTNHGTIQKIFVKN
jgi:hypothetical protein